MAKLRDHIADWFRSSKSDEEQYYDDEAEASPSYPAIVNAENRLTPQNTVSETNVQPEQQADNGPTTRSAVVIPYWLEDEDTLRDEGVLFGLSESDPTEKTDIIHKYFTHLTAEHIGYIEQNNERIQELNLFIGQKSNRIDELTDKLKIREDLKKPAEHHLPRTLIGLALSIAMCVCNFYLIRESLKPAFADSSWIALGVFLAGMFSLFGRISMFHDTESRVTWRALLEEIGLPFASALFVFANTLPHQTWWQAMSLFIFVFFLFLFAGKLFLSNVTVLRNDLHAWTSMHRERKDAQDNFQNWEDEVQDLQGEVDALRVKKWQILREQSNSEMERDRLNARRDMLVKLFESEFFLARRMKNQLSGKQLQFIQKSSE